MAGSRFVTDDAHLSRVIGRVLIMGTCFKIRHRPAKENELADTMSRLKHRGDVIQGFEDEWVMASTGVPVSHLQLPKDFMEKAPKSLPSQGLDGETEVSMRELVAHM